MNHQLKKFMDYEKNINKNSIINNENFQDIKYAPQTGHTFEVESYWVHIEYMDIFYVENSLLNTFLKVEEKKVLFLIHPESKDIYLDLINNSEKGDNFKAIATSSSRTLLVYNEKSPDILFFAKLSLNKIIGRTNRTIPKGEVSRSIGTTIILKFFKDKNLLPANFEYFSEVIGVIPKGMERGGMIIREIHPDLYTKDIMPCFSLHMRQLETAPIEKMYDESNNSSFEEFITSFLINPFLKLYIELSLLGISTEPHGQNLLIGERFYYRDFGGFNIDLSYISKKYDFPIEKLPFIDNLDEEYHQRFHQNSIVESLSYFSNGIINEILDYRYVNEKYFVNLNKSVDLIKESFERIIKEDYHLKNINFYKYAEILISLRK